MLTTFVVVGILVILTLAFLSWRVFTTPQGGKFPPPPATITPRLQPDQLRFSQPVYGK